MRLRIGGLLTAFVILLPLLALPMFAVFGVPQLQPILQLLNRHQGQTGNSSAGSRASGGSQLSRFNDPPRSSANRRGGEAPWGDGARSAIPFHSNADFRDDPYQQVVGGVGHAGTSADRPSTPSTPPNALLGWERAPGQPVVHAHMERDRTPVVGPSNSTGNGVVTASGNQASAPQSNIQSTAEPLTWRSATERLNRLGVRRFLLQPGQRENEFHFSCYFTPVDNPRITHRFEAEAAEPLRAVQKVLDQIEERLQTQHRPRPQSNH